MVYSTNRWWWLGDGKHGIVLPTLYPIGWWYTIASLSTPWQNQLYTIQNHDMSHIFLMIYPLLADVFIFFMGPRATATDQALPIRLKSQARTEPREKAHGMAFRDASIATRLVSSLAPRVACLVSRRKMGSKIGKKLEDPRGNIMTGWYFDLPLWKRLEFVNLDDHIPNWMGK